MLGIHTQKFKQINPFGTSHNCTCGLMQNMYIQIVQKHSSLWLQISHIVNTYNYMSQTDKYFTSYSFTKPSLDYFSN